MVVVVWIWLCGLDFGLSVGLVSFPTSDFIAAGFCDRLLMPVGLFVLDCCFVG